MVRAAASAKVLYFSPTNPQKNERVNVRGELPGSARYAVSVQVRKPGGSGWVEVGSANAKGQYEVITKPLRKVGVHKVRVVLSSRSRPDKVFTRSRLRVHGPLGGAFRVLTPSDTVPLVLEPLPRRLAVATPDHSKVLFGAKSSAGVQWFVEQGGVVQPVALPATVSAVCDLSADGSILLFWNSRARSVSTVDLNTAVVTTAPTAPQTTYCGELSADGRFAALTVYEYQGAGDDVVVVWDRVTGTLTQAPAPASAEFFQSVPTMSADGQRVAYEEWTPDTPGSYPSDVVVWDRQSGAARTLSDGHSGWSETRLEMSADGGTLLATLPGSNGSGRGQDLVLIDVATAGKTLVARSRNHEYLAGALSGDGSAVAYWLSRPSKAFTEVNMWSRTTDETVTLAAGGPHGLAVRVAAMPNALSFTGASVLLLANDQLSATDGDSKPDLYAWQR